VRFLLGLAEAKVCVKMTGFYKFACGPKEYSFVFALFAELNRILQEFSSNAKRAHKEDKGRHSKIKRRMKEGDAKYGKI
jgi:hypothetical protein